MRENLYKKLEEYSKSGIYPFCMPGHKRNFQVERLENPYLFDITEVYGFDDLHDAHGILKEITDEAGEVYGCKNVFISVNGSTACNLAAITTIPGSGPVLAASNCHRSVINGMKINGREMISLEPERIDGLEIPGGITAKSVEEHFEKCPEIKGVILTSPTYEGLISDIKAIAEVVHSHGAVLIVDEAHGAHLPFSRRFPKSAISLGADMVIHSLHKTMGSFNQTAFLIVPNDELAKKAHENLLMYMTTSPSYLLMASMQEAVQRAVSPEGQARMDSYVSMLETYNVKFESLKHIHFLGDEYVGKYGIAARDPSKLVFLPESYSGPEFMELMLEKYRLQLEKCEETYVVAMTSMYDSEEGFERLWRALQEIDNEIDGVI